MSAIIRTSPGHQAAREPPGRRRALIDAFIDMAVSVLKH